MKPFNWWLRELPYMLFLPFWPNILGGGGDLWMALCHSINVVWVVGHSKVVRTLRSGGDTQTLPVVIRCVRTVCTQRWWTHWISFFMMFMPLCSWRPTSHLVKLSLPNIFFCLAHSSSLLLIITCTAITSKKINMECCRNNCKVIFLMKFCAIVYFII